MKQYLEIYRKNLFESVIPFWMNHSIDTECGGYFTCLDEKGAVFDDSKYVWLQARQVWMFAKLYNTVREDPQWLAIAEHGMHFLRKCARLPDGRVCFSMDRAGQPKAIQRKIFSECFLLLALAEMYRATREEIYREEAIALLNLIEQFISEPELLGRPILPGARATRNLAIPMIYLNLIEEMDGILDEEDLKVKRESSIHETLAHLDPDLKVFRENLDDNGIFNDLPEGRLINPGHSIEACWFLLHAAGRCELPEIWVTILEALQGSLSLGWDHDEDGLFYFIDADGKPPRQLEWSMKLWWPHTEALYALALAFTLTGDHSFEQWHQRIHEYAFTRFADEVDGEWFGYCDRYGKVTHRLKGGDYKGCFHVPRALLYTVKVLERL